MLFTSTDFLSLKLPPGIRDLRRDVRAFLDEQRAAGRYEPHVGHGEFDPAFSQALGARGWIGMTWPRQYGGHERSYLERFVVTEELLAAAAPARHNREAAGSAAVSEAGMLIDAIGRIFSDHYTSEHLQEAKRSGWSEPLWRALEETGMTLLSVPEDCGGGGDFADGIEALRLAGRYCASVPFAETALLAGWALARSGIAIPRGPLAFAVAPHVGTVTITQAQGGWKVAGVLRDIAWARVASALVLVAPHAQGAAVCCIPRAKYEVAGGANLAHEARDEVRLSTEIDAQSVRTDTDMTVDAAWRRGALVRAVLMSGALDGILELTVAYTRQRAQFGRNLIQFQAVQQELARLAGEAAIAKAAALTAAAHIDDAYAELYVAAAKVKAGEAACSGASIAHQLHGAIGVTDEYLLHHSTMRLWSWRSEYGTEAQWAQKLGADALELGGAALWARITEG
jgi:acyl-CoA dehydrogenase